MTTKTKPTTKQIDALRRRIDIVEYIGRTVDLEPIHGSTLHMGGRCPLAHETRDGRIVVLRQHLTWYCHTCRQGGDVFAFRTATEGGTFLEAVAALAAEYPER